MASGGYVLDASALLCLIFQEPGAVRLEACLPGARMGAANLAEVIGKLVDLGVDGAATAREIAELDFEIVPLDRRQTEAAGCLHATTRGIGPPLGDRCCLALAETLDATALTTDRAWAGVPGPIAVDACPLNADARSGRRSGTARWRYDRRVPDAERQTGAVSGFNGTWCRAVSVWTMIQAQ